MPTTIQNEHRVFRWQDPDRLGSRGFPLRLLWFAAIEVTFAEWTDDEQMRQTVFLGWRDDKKPEEVVLEKP
jgi:hypothetical protein